MKSANLNFLESSGPLQACNGTALSLPLIFEGKTDNYLTRMENSQEKFEDLQVEGMRVIVWEGIKRIYRA
jgi:hypothetical protein